MMARLKISEDVMEELKMENTGKLQQSIKCKKKKKKTLHAEQLLIWLWILPFIADLLDRVTSFEDKNKGLSP